MAAYTNWIVGDVVQICIKLEDFCGEFGNNALFFSSIVGSMDIQKSGVPCNITCNRPNCSWFCINTTNRLISAYSCMNHHPSSGGATCANFTAKADKIYRKLGDAYTDSSGIAHIIHTITDQDLADYQDAITNTSSYDVFVCCDAAEMTGNVKAIENITITQNLCAGVSCNDTCIGNNLYWQTCDPQTGNCIQGALKEANSLRCLPATHSVDLQLGLVPAELVQYFSQYITGISDGLINWMTTNVPLFSLPANWIYLRTEYDQVTNMFKLMMHYTGVLSTGSYYTNNQNYTNNLGFTYNTNTLDISTDLAALWDWLRIYKFAILAGIIAIMAVILVTTIGLTWYVALWLIGAVTILTFDIIYLSTQIKEYEQRVKNAETIVGQQDKENGQIVNIDNTWNNSPKARSDCLTRLESLRDLHKRIISGYAEQYNGVVSIVNSMNTENDTFTADAKAIIDQFNADPNYSAPLCDSYYAMLRNKIDQSNLRINDIISTKAPGGSGGDYQPQVLCSDHTTKAECETAGCQWDNGICKAKECAIPSPLGGCLLYKETASSILVFGAALLLGVVALGIVSSGPPKRRD